MDPVLELKAVFDYEVPKPPPSTVHTLSGTEVQYAEFTKSWISD